MSTAEPRPPARATAWGGIAFAVLYVVAVMSMFANAPDLSGSDGAAKWLAEYRKYYADSGNRTSVLIGVFVLSLACIAAVVFGAHLRDRLAAAGSATSGRLAFAGSIMLGTLMLAGGTAIAWIPGSIAFGDAPLPKGEIAYYGPQLGFGALLLGGGTSAALMLVATAVGSVRSGALPAWLSWAAGVVAVIVFALSVFFVPMVLLALWMLIAGIVGLRRPFTRDVAATV